MSISKDEQKRVARIPVNIISGPLGTGKTTTINHLMKQRPKHERWAILVNEYGLVGLDAALMETKNQEEQVPGVDIREVSGGCICCSAGLMFNVSLMLLLERKPDRLLIEPTGLAALSGILNTLDRPGVRELLDLRSIVCLLDPVRIREDLVREEVSDQVEAADVLLANRSDLASKEQLQKFDRWGAALFPPKRFVGQIEQGRIPLELLDLVSKRDTAIRRAGHTHGTDHQHKEAPESQTQTPKTDIVCGPDRPIVRRSHRSTVTSTVGWICFETLEFDAKRISCWLNEIAQLPGARRTKAVLRTNEGWWAFNFANGAEDVHPSGYRRDSRIEFIFEGQQFPNDQELEDALRRCLRLESELVGEKHAGERSS